MDDESVLSSESQTVEDVPSDGILIILQLFTNGTWQALHGQDFYLWNSEEWQAGSERDLERWLRKLLPQLKYGRWSRTTGWRKAMKAAGAWADTHNLDRSLEAGDVVLQRDDG